MKKYFTRHGLRVDPVERTKKLRIAMAEIKEEVEKKVCEVFSVEKYEDCGMGACHAFWDFQKEILKKRHQIAWKNPSEMNPRIIFD